VEVQLLPFALLQSEQWVLRLDRFSLV
jgi:hypothetical protein